MNTECDKLGVIELNTMLYNMECIYGGFAAYNLLQIMCILSINH